MGTEYGNIISDVCNAESFAVARLNVIKERLLWQRTELN